MDVLIFGAGGVGLGIASALLADGAGVRIVGRPTTIQALQREGLRRSGWFGDFQAPSDAFLASESLDDAAGAPPDYVLVTVKSYDSADAARLLADGSAVLGEAPLVLCQNGWGNAEHFTSRFSEQRVWNARVITGFVRPAPHHVDVTAHADAIHIGSLYGRDPAPMGPLCDSIARGGIPCATTAEIARDLWAKLLYNGLLNPLGALFGVPYGALGDSAESRAMMEDLAREIFAVMHAAGHETHWASAEAYLEHFYARLLPITAKHESSMLHDVRSGGRTEIDAMLGVVVDLGRRAGVAAPVAETLARAVRFLEGR